MTQSTFHVAVIMDGNGRWASERGLPRNAGHRAGAEAVRRVIEAAPDAGIDLLTLYAFSSDNWKRPRPEVEALMVLFERFLRRETARCVEAGVRLNVIGRRDRLSASLVGLIEESERSTAAGDRVRVRLAIDYSSRDALSRAASLGSGDYRRRLTEAIHADALVEDVDLLIRTGREKRLSDFLLFEAAYAELHFTDCLWPDFTADDLHAALNEFRRRDRRFGSIRTETQQAAACTT
jgi:undecaprenyl diphosphate synthase